MKIKVKWKDPKGAPPRCEGYIEEIDPSMAHYVNDWVARGLCEVLEEPKRKPRSIKPKTDAPVTTKAIAEPVTKKDE